MKGRGRKVNDIQHWWRFVHHNNNNHRVHEPFPLFLSHYLSLCLIKSTRLAMAMTYDPILHFKYKTEGVMAADNRKSAV